MKTFLVLALASLIGILAKADGNLGFSLKNREGFLRVDIVEKEAVREGTFSLGGNRYYLTAFEQDGYLNLPFAQYPNDKLEIKPYDEKHIWYRGFMWGGMIMSVDVYHDMKKGTMRMFGKIGDNLDFTYETNINKKGKRSSVLRWLDKGERYPVELALEIDFTSEKKAGSCKGILRAELEEVAQFACKSDGKLTDAFYKNEKDVFAWIIHLLITPADANRKSSAISQFLKH